MSQSTYQASLILSFKNNTGAEIPKHRLVSFSPEATTLTGVYPTAATGRAMGVTIDSIGARDNINVQVGGVVLIELATNTTVSAGGALQAAADGKAAAHTSTNTVVARAIDAVTSSPAGTVIRAVLTNA